MLAGLVVALALIPEAISFSIIAGVDPQVGLFSESEDGLVAHYTVDGELFFASSNDLTTLFEYADDPDRSSI